MSESTGFISLWANLIVSISILDEIREDSQIDFSMHNVNWTLSPDPHPP